MQMASRNSAFKQCKNHSLLGVREKPPVLLVDIYSKKMKKIKKTLDKVKNNSKILVKLVERP